jgi:5,10-methylenetetrahydrofolate reductase
MSSAVMRMSSLGGGMILQGEGMETVIQCNCRDRNRIALQADLLSAYACGITNIMAVTGEDPGFGDHHQARPVYDIDLLELLGAISGLQNGKDMAGIELLGAPEFLVGATVDAGAKGKSTELVIEEMNRKIETGAQFFVTPPLFDLSVIEPFLKRVDLGKTTIIPTVLLLKSTGMARYIQRNLDSVYIPDSLVQRIQESSDKVRECMRISLEMVKTLQREGFGGVLLSTIGWEHKLPEIVEKI